MKIKITDVLPIVNPPEVGSVHTVTRRETEPPRNRRTKMYYIEVGKNFPGRPLGPGKRHRSGVLPGRRYHTNGNFPPGH